MCMLFLQKSRFCGTLAANQDDTCVLLNTIGSFSTELVDSGQDLGNLAQTQQLVESQVLHFDGQLQDIDH